MKYDIEMVIPVCTRGHYGRRINDFKKYGLLNVRDKKVLVTLLVGLDNPGDLKNGWAENVDVNIVRYNLNHEACKVYNYFANYPLTNEARWIAKIDDDSINDVDVLVDQLDRYFDHNKDYYVVTILQDDLNEVEEGLLHSMGFGHWFAYSDREPYIIHEVEGSVVSVTGMKSILSTPSALELMQKRSVIQDGYTDVCLAAAARMAKIYPSHARFMSHEPFLGDFTLFGGNMSHVHFISHDRNTNLFDALVKKIENNRSPAEQELRAKLIDKKYLLTCENENSIAVLVFQENNHIWTQSASDYYNWKIWEISRDRLVISANDGEACIEFAMENLDESRGHSNGMSYRLNRIL